MPRKPGPPKDQPVSVRLDRPTIEALEAIGDAIKEMTGAKVSTSALIDAAIREYIENRGHLAKGRKR